MTWPTVTLVLGCLAFVAFVAALAVHLMTVIVRKDAGMPFELLAPTSTGDSWEPPGTRTRYGA